MKFWMRAAAMLTVICVLMGNCLGLEVEAPSAILIDGATGTVLFEKDADTQRAPASVTKVMTLLLVMEAVDSGTLGWEEPITASAVAAGKGGSQVYLEEGEQMPLWEMVKCVVVSSANDCATALAEAVAGSESGFVERMNQRTQELGMVNTHFANCTGLDDEAGADVHYTSPRDIAIMSRELLKHDKIREFTTIWMDTIRDGSFGLSNTNKLVRFYKGTTGLKTGFTSNAGYCMSASAERDGMELIAVVMKCDSSTQRFESAKTMLEYGFANYALVDPAEGVQMETVPVVLGKEEEVAAMPKEGQPILLEKSKAAGISREVSLQESVQAPVAQGQTIGTLTLKNGEEVIAEVPLVAEQKVERLGFGDIYMRLLRYLWMG